MAQKSHNKDIQELVEECSDYWFEPVGYEPMGEYVTVEFTGRVPLTLLRKIERSDYRFGNIYCDTNTMNIMYPR